MLKYNLLLFLRNIRNQKIPNAINLIGLSVGFACTILIFFWITYELSFDTFHKYSDEIYRVARKYENPDGSIDFSPVTVMPLAEELKASFPDIIETTRFNDAFGEFPVKHEDKLLFAKGAPADKEFFDVFNFPFRYGNRASIFNSNSSIIISESLSNKLFGKENPVGEMLEFELWGRWNNFEVAAVISDIPANSNFDFEMIFPVNFLISMGWDENNWLNGTIQTYLLTSAGTDLKELAKKIEPLNREHHPKATALLILQPLTKIHLYNLEGGGRITYVYIFAAIALIILLISCINFVNITTAVSGKRLKEVGVRKVIGARRSQVGKQFLLESVWFAVFSLLIALFLVKSGVPILNSIADTSIEFHLFETSTLLFIGVALMIGIVSGVYPSAILSSSKFTFLSKNKITTRGFHGLPLSRGILVGFQFLISVILIVGATTIYKQLLFIKDKNLGFTKEHIIRIPIQSELRDPAKQEILKQKLLTNPCILSVSVCNSNFTNWQYTADENDISWEGKQPNDKITMEVNSVDYDYLNTFGMEMADGRFFSKEFPTDGYGAVILNETAVKALNIQSPIGQQFSYHGNRRIIGVVKNFNFTSLHQKINPLMLIIDPSQYHSAYLKMRGDNIASTLQYIEKSVQQVIPDYMFGYSFLDDDLNELYNTEQSAGKLISAFSMLAVIIVCLGILGLIIHATENRTKEIGIRKVNGAKVSEILILLNKDIAKWGFLAFVFASPIAYFSMNKWLQSFAYRTKLSWWIFVLSGLLVLGIALLTVSWQSWRAATRNPVEALRYE